MRRFLPMALWCGKWCDCHRKREKTAGFRAKLTRLGANANPPPCLLLANIRSQEIKWMKRDSGSLSGRKSLATSSRRPGYTATPRIKPLHWMGICSVSSLVGSAGSKCSWHLLTLWTICDRKWAFLSLYWQFSSDKAQGRQTWPCPALPSFSEWLGWEMTTPSPSRTFIERHSKWLHKKKKKWNTLRKDARCCQTHTFLTGNNWKTHAGGGLSLRRSRNGHTWMLTRCRVF